LRQPAEFQSDEIDGIDPLTVALEAVLPEPSAHVDQVALADVLAHVGLGPLREDRDFVPVRVVLPLIFVVLEGIVGADANS
jgi:hypothetical protein